MNKLILILLLAVMTTPLIAQDELKCGEGDAIDKILANRKADKIVGASIVSQTEKSITISVEIEGFKEGAYEIKGIMMSRESGTKSTRGIKSKKAKVPKGGGSVDITFNLKDDEVRTSKPYLETKYVKFVISKASESGGLSDILGGIEGLELNMGGGTELTCECQKKWRLSGENNASMVIEVELTPYKSTAQTQYKKRNTPNTGVNNGTTIIGLPYFPIHSTRRNNELKGPKNPTIDAVSEIDYAYDIQSDILHSYIYRDGNKALGYYYYLPKGYYLNFSEQTGEYEINVNYNSSSAGMGRTTVTATLSPKLSRKELEFTKELLKDKGLKELVPMPMSQPPEIAFDNLSQFGINAEKDVSIRAPADFDSPILMSFTTDNIDELMGMFFNNIGLYGSVIIYPEGGEDMPSSINLGEFKLSSRRWRNGWQNKTDYPVILNAFHAMKKESNGEYSIYTWTTGDVEVPEKAKVNFKSKSVPSWVDNYSSTRKVWMEYTVQNCRSCDVIIKDKIIGGVAGSRVHNIEFDILNPIDFTGAEFIKLKVRSFQADPNGRSKTNLPSQRIEEDGVTLAGGQLYVPDGESPEFEYQLQVVLPNGEKHYSDWIKTNETDVVIGKNQIQSYFDDF